MAWCDFPITLTNHSMKKVYDVPCGKCLPCQSKKADHWGLRMVEEWRDSRNAFFVTLTYSDSTLNYADDPIVSTGELVPTLCKRDVQLFWKRLRKAGHKVRYYVCGEYGTKTHRPHYHAIIYNLNVDSYDEACNVISHHWIHGFTVTKAFNYNRARYVAKYVQKRSDATDWSKMMAEHLKGFVHEFSNCSRSPAIGDGYIDRMKEYHRADLFNRYFVNTPEGYKKSLPRRWKERIYTPIQRKAISQHFINKMDKESMKEYNDLGAYGCKVKDDMRRERNQIMLESEIINRE